MSFTIHLRILFCASFVSFINLVEDYVQVDLGKNDELVAPITTTDSAIPPNIPNQATDLAIPSDIPNQDFTSRCLKNNDTGMENHVPNEKDMEQEGKLFLYCFFRNNIIIPRITLYILKF